MVTIINTSNFYKNEDQSIPTENWQNQKSENWNFSQLLLLLFSSKVQAVKTKQSRVHPSMQPRQVFQLLYRKIKPHDNGKQEKKENNIMFIYFIFGMWYVHPIASGWHWTTY